MTQANLLELKQVTLCAATSVNVEATARALQLCMRSIRYAKVLLFTDDLATTMPAGVERVSISRLGSTQDYSRFLLRDLCHWIETSHCLVVQWDGFVLNADRWDPRFLDYDYIGAPWPQFEDGHDVGNGGFSLRSRHLLAACLDPEFHHDGLAEDLTIARTNRAFLERTHAIKFADTGTAARFSHERPLPCTSSCPQPEKWLNAAFGFHGAFNMPRAVGPGEFAKIYRSLDHKATVSTDLWRIAWQLSSMKGGRLLAMEVLLRELEIRLSSSRRRQGRD